MNPLAASLPNRQRVPGFPLQHMGNNHARRLPKPPTPGRLQSDALHQRPLILSLSKDAGSSLTWFDRLTMSSLGRTLQSSCRQHRAQSNTDIQTACSVQGPEASRCLCLSTCLRPGGSAAVLRVGRDPLWSGIRVTGKPHPETYAAMRPRVFCTPAAQSLLPGQSPRPAGTGASPGRTPSAQRPVPT